MATVSQWNPFGVSLNITATGSNVKRISATQFQVDIAASWETYWSSNKTNYGMSVSTGNQSNVVISAFDGTKRHSGSKTFAAKYSITGNGSQTKTITVTFRNYNDDNDDSKTKSVSFNVSVPAWTSYIVSYNANGGSNAPVNQTKWKDQKLTLSSAKPTRTGYTFSKWSTKSDGSGTSYNPGSTYSGNANITLYAIWTPITYTVSYNANGGSNPPGNQTKTYGVTLKLSTVEPTRTDYTFLGWSTSKTATTATYPAGGSYTANSGVTLYAVWKLAYVKPTIKNLKVTRHETAGGPQSDSGSCARVRFDWTTFNSTPTITIKIGNNEPIYIGATGTSGLVNWYADVDLNPDITYSVTVTVDDGTTPISVSKPLTGAKYVIDLLKGGNGIAFGKAAELSGVADIAYETKLRKPLYVDNNMAFSGYDPNGTLVEFMNPMNENGNTVLGYGNYDRGAGNTNIYGHDVHIGTSNIANPGYYRPYQRRGDSISFNLRTSGYVTNAGTEVTFTVPFAVPIVGSPTVTITSGDGFILRQGNKYTHGSTASVYTFPASYNAYVSQWMGVTVTAVFTDTTNVTNNDAIGIHWKGTITFS